MSKTNADGSVTISVGLDTADMKKDIKNVESGFGGLMSSIKKLGIAAAAAFGISKLVAFGREAVEMASDLDEVQNVVDVAFGSMKQKIEDFAKTSIESFGISELSAKKTASVYMSMARGMSIGEEAASDMAIKLTGLTADMSSFYNVSQQTADVAIKSIFTGETETLKQYGIIMSQVNLQEFARTQGITKAISKMTQQEQVMLRYNYVLSKTALAQGDFSRTSDGWANSTRVISERWKVFETTIGGAFKALASLVLPAINDIIARLTALAEHAQTAANQIATLFHKINYKNESTDATAEATEKTAENIEKATDAQKALNKEQKKTQASFDTIEKLSESTASAVEASAPEELTNAAADESASSESSEPEKNDTSFADGLIAEIERLKKSLFENTSLDEWLSTIKSKITNQWSTLTGDFKSFLGNTKSLMSNIGGILSSSIIDCSPQVIDATGKLLLGVKTFALSYADTIVQAFDDTMIGIDNSVTENSDTIKKYFDNLQLDFSSFAGNIGMILSDLGTDTNTWWKEKMSPVWQRFSSAISDIGITLMSVYNEWISPVIKYISAGAKRLWSEHMEPLYKNFLNLYSTVVDKITLLYNNTLKPFVDNIINTLKPFVVGALKNIWDVIQAFGGMTIDIISGIVKYLTGLIDFLTGVFTDDWDLAWQGVKEMAAGAWGAIWGVIKGIINIIIGGINVFLAGLYVVIRSVADGISKAVEFAGELMGKKWSFRMPDEAPRIPLLAQGAVLPPNKPFMAMVGDQKNGMNIETPLSTMIEAFKAAFAETGGSSVEISFAGNESELIRYLAPKITAVNKYRGKNIITGGQA